MDSILQTVKKMLGIDPLNTDFDAELIVYINSAIATLYQIGVGEAGYAITSETETWGDYIETIDDKSLIQTYIYMKVRFLFDPPTGAAKEALDNLLKEYEWRIHIVH